ncbi:hypothetical protein I4U23_003875 [Adineta vaga]|nr:hypothetical protein I4U23_003875 [Adineta vaga]
MENFTLVWFDPDINMIDTETKTYIKDFRRIINSIQIFTDLFECCKYALAVKDTQMILIVSKSFKQDFAEMFFMMKELRSVYISSKNISTSLESNQFRSKMKGTFNDIQGLSSTIKDDIYRFENNQIPIDVITSTTLIQLMETEPKFYYSILIKENLYEKGQRFEQGKQAFIDSCRVYYANNDEQIEVINEFNDKYALSTSIWWYTRDCFISRILNKAFRIQDFETIIKMNFFIRNLHRQIEQVYLETIPHCQITTYHSQGITHAILEKLKHNKNNLISFNTFLLTNTNRDLALNMARHLQESNELISILFRITIDPSISQTPFVTLDGIAYSQEMQNRILFSFQPIFRIGEMNKNDNNMFEIELTLIDHYDEQMKDFIRHNLKPNETNPGFIQIGTLINEKGELDKAEKIFTALLQTTSDKYKEGLLICHLRLAKINLDKNDLQVALLHFQKSITILSIVFSADDRQLALPYDQMGLIYQRQGDDENALKHMQIALKLEVQGLEPMPLHIVQILENIGSVYQNQRRLTEALIYYKRALQIALVYISSDYLMLSTIHNNIGVMHLWMKNYTDALSYFEKTLEIQNTHVSSDHRSLATSYSNMALALDGLDRTNEAVEYSVKAVNLACRILGFNHPDTDSYLCQLTELQSKTRHRI